MWDLILGIVLGVLAIILALVVSVHVILTIRNERSAIAWLGLVVLVPIVGTILYYTFGINRVQRRSRSIREHVTARTGRFGRSDEPAVFGEQDTAVALFLQQQDDVADRFGLPHFTPGNRIDPLINGEAAYPAMLTAIDGAERSIALSTYIFNQDSVGERFVSALAAAHKRDVSVRVLVDGIGSLYSRPSIISRLVAENIPARRFLFSLVPSRMPYLNMRNHQKILVVDGRIGFTGGMNIKEAHLAEAGGAHATRDVHFRLEGPVVGHLMATFANEWLFTTEEELDGDAWFPPLAESGTAIARGHAAGPDSELETIRWILLGAIGEAHRHVRIVTPYFLPDEALVTQLCLAAIRGVDIDIVMPARNNLPLVQWASMSHLDEMIVAGCRFWLTPPPFDHSKLMVVDDDWSFFGSTNWDPRSLRLNFEFNVECFDHPLAHRLAALIDGKISEARPLTIDDIVGRSFPVALRDGITRLLRPYL